MLSLIRYADFLGEKETIRVNDRKHFQSLYGGLISIIVIILSLIMSVYLTVKNYMKIDPSVTYSRQIMEYMDNSMINKEELDFFISLEFPNSTYYLDDTIYTIQGVQMEAIFDEKDSGKVKSIIEKPFEFMKCSELYTQKELSKLNVNFPADLFYCPPLNEIKIGGYWGGHFYNSIKVYIHKCNNETAIAKNPNRPCKPIEEINSCIDKGIVNIFISDYILDQQNYDSPVKKYYKDVFDRISDKNSVNYLIAYSKLSFENDEGLILNEYNSRNFTVIHEIKNSYYFGESELIVFFQLFKINYNDVYQRQYPKIHDLVTKIGGFIKALSLLGYFLYYIYLKPFRIFHQLSSSHCASLSKLMNNKNCLFSHKNINRIRLENSGSKNHLANWAEEHSNRNSNPKLNSKNNCFNFSINPYNPKYEINIAQQDCNSGTNQEILGKYKTIKIARMEKKATGNRDCIKNSFIVTNSNINHNHTTGNNIQTNSNNIHRDHITGNSPHKSKFLTVRKTFKENAFCFNNCNNKEISKLSIKSSESKSSPLSSLKIDYKAKRFINKEVQKHNNNNDGNNNKFSSGAGDLQDVNTKNFTKNSQEDYVNPEIKHKASDVKDDFKVLKITNNGDHRLNQEKKHLDHQKSKKYKINYNLIFYHLYGLVKYIS